MLAIWLCLLPCCASVPFLLLLFFAALAASLFLFFCWLFSLGWLLAVFSGSAMPLVDGFAKREARQARARARARMDITIQAALSGASFQLPTRASMNVWGLLNVCLDRFDVAGVKTPVLIFGHQRLEWNRTLSYYNIQQGATLQLYWEQVFVHFFVVLPHTRVTVTAWPHTTIANIQFQVFSVEGIPPPQQRLSFADQQLEHDRTVGDYNIRVGDAVRCEVLPQRPRWRALRG